MGQYHEIWAFKEGQKAETIDHYAFGCGAKLGEQTWKDNPYAAAVGLLAAGRWADRKLVVIGDYSEPSDVPDFAEPLALPAYFGAAPRDPAYRPGGKRFDPATDLDYSGMTSDISDFALGLVGEATGWSAKRASYDNDDYGWREAVQPDDWDDRVERWRKMGRDDPTCIVSSKGEYIRPEAFGSPAHRLAAPCLGSAWSIVIGLLACSDGRGGGDLELEPPGRWAYSQVGMLPAGEVGGFDDITDLVLRQNKVVRWVLGDE